MDITFNDYIQNPMSKENAVFSNRYMYRDLYMSKLDKILVRENGKVDYHLYYTKDKSRYYIHIRVPSEIIEEFYYDTVIEFYTKDNIKAVSNTIIDYNVKFYSNDPSFVFTFAHSFIHNKLFVEDLVSKMSKEAVKKVAKEKNPTNQVGYVKSIYFAYLICKQYGLFNKIKFSSEGVLYDKKRFLDTITHADIKVQDRIDKGNELNKKNKVEKIKEKNKKSRPEPTNTENIKYTKGIGNRRNIRTTKSTKVATNGNIKKSGMIKRI